MKCRKCNRPLTNPKWVALGIGPKCLKKGFFEVAKQANDPDLITTPYLDGAGLVVSREGGLKGINIPWVLTRHSPTGLEWGYGGSGPADLALNALFFFSKDLEFAQEHYQDFKWLHIAGIPQAGGTVPLETITRYIASKRPDRQLLIH